MDEQTHLEVLLVEDEPAHVELIQRAFAARGESFHLTVAETTAGALKQIKTIAPSLIITDYILPDGQGTELILNTTGARPIPVIVMTSHGNERVAVDALKAGAMDYVVKSDASLADMPHIAERVLREWDNRIQRQKAEQELRYRVSELEAVNRISTALRSAMVVKEILPIVLDEALAALHAEVGMIWLYRQETTKLHPSCGRGWLAEKATEPIQYGKCVPGFVFVSGQMRISEDFIADPLASEEGAKKFKPGWGGAWMPVHTADQVVGVLLVAVPAPRRLSPEEIHLLSTVAEIAGNAIHRASLFEQTERSIRRLSALRTIDMAISASTDLNLSLSVLLTQAAILLDADAIAILQLNPLTQTLEVLAEKGFSAGQINKRPIRMGQGYAGIAALERRAINISDLSKVPQTNGSRFEMVRSEAFSAYHVTPLISRGYTKGVFEVFHRNPYQPGGEWSETMDTLAGQAAIAIENAGLFDELQKSNIQLRMAYDATIEGWSRALDLRDRETEGHTQRVTELTVQLARLMGLDEDALANIRRGALLHDIGKMGIPDAILNKPGPLTDEEWEIMRQHPVFAKTLISSIEYLRPAVDIPYSHHERWDGTGYPLGLKGEAIPLPARIFAVVDVWDALRSDRPYRTAWPMHKIDEYIRTQAQKHFDPQIVKLFLQKVAK